MDVRRCLHRGFVIRCAFDLCDVDSCTVPEVHACNTVKPVSHSSVRCRVSLDIPIVNCEVEAHTILGGMDNV